MKGYGQICPLSRAAEVVGERWNLLILRALLYGEQNFNSLRKSMSSISPTLLSERLKTLEQAGIVERIDDDAGVKYQLTAAGEALQPALNLLGQWGAEFTASNVAATDFDMGHLMWEMPRRVDVDVFDVDRVMIYRFCVDRAVHPEFFLVVAQRYAKVIFKLPKGMSPTLTLSCDMATLGRLWLGEQTFDAARQNGAIVVDGEEKDWQLLNSGLRLNMFSDSNRG